MIVGGPANRKDPYAASCANSMEYLAGRFPKSFWAAPNDFFLDGSIVNLGADFGMMPSAFEPGGIVQHEFFVGGTPVIAYKTGGLKDSVFEFRWDTDEGNGFLLDAHNRGAFIYAVERAYGTYLNKEKYKILRENSFKSTMDGARVTREWCKEFYRLREKVFIDKEVEDQEIRKIPEEFDYTKYNDDFIDEYIFKTCIAPQRQGETKEVIKFEKLSDIMKKNTGNTPVTFKINLGAKKAYKVQIAGSFNDWKVRHDLNYDQYTGSWFVTLHLTKGKYM